MSVTDLLKTRLPAELQAHVLNMYSSAIFEQHKKKFNKCLLELHKRFTDPWHVSNNWLHKQTEIHHNKKSNIWHYRVTTKAMLQVIPLTYFNYGIKRD